MALPLADLLFFFFLGFNDPFDSPPVCICTFGGWSFLYISVIDSLWTGSAASVERWKGEPLYLFRGISLLALFPWCESCTA